MAHPRRRNGEHIPAKVTPAEGRESLRGNFGSKRTSAQLGRELINGAPVAISPRLWSGRKSNHPRFEFNPLPYEGAADDAGGTVVPSTVATNAVKRSPALKRALSPAFSRPKIPKPTMAIASPSPLPPPFRFISPFKGTLPSAISSQSSFAPSLPAFPAAPFASSDTISPQAVVPTGTTAWPLMKIGSSTRNLKRSPGCAVRLVISLSTIKRTGVPGGKSCLNGSASVVKADRSIIGEIFSTFGGSAAITLMVNETLKSAAAQSWCFIWPAQRKARVRQT